MPTLTLPVAGIDVEYRGFSGREEDLLADRKKMMDGSAIEEILTACVVRFGEQEKALQKDISELVSADREVLLFGVRRETFGDTVEVPLKCDNQNCQEAWNVEVDLSTIEVKPMPAGDRPFSATLSSGVTITFDYLTGKGEKVLSKQQQNLLSKVLELRLRSVEGVHENGVKKWLLDAPAKVRHEIRAAMKKMDCGPQSEKTADCPTCGKEISFNPERSPNFLYPQE